MLENEFICGSLDLSLSKAPALPKAIVSEDSTPNTTRKRMPLADIDTNVEDFHQESPGPAPSKGGKREAPKNRKKRATLVEEVPQDADTPKKKKRKSKQSKHKGEATGTILDLAEFDEAQKTTVVDETCKGLKLIVQRMAKLAIAVDDMKEIMVETAKS